MGTFRQTENGLTRVLGNPIPAWVLCPQSHGLARPTECKHEKSFRVPPHGHSPPEPFPSFSATTSKQAFLFFSTFFFRWHCSIETRVIHDCELNVLHYWLAQAGVYWQLLLVLELHLSCLDSLSVHKVCLSLLTWNVAHSFFFFLHCTLACVVFLISDWSGFILPLFRNFTSCPVSLFTQVPAKPLLPQIKSKDAGKICVVIDLDETLVHSSFKVSCWDPCSTPWPLSLVIVHTYFHPSILLVLVLPRTDCNWWEILASMSY